jgi:8-oxo-dGTP diphosphatase
VSAVIGGVPRRLHVVGAAIVEGGRVFLARRGPAMSMPGKWEFPGGKVEAGEAPEAALVREVAEELGVEIELGDFLGRGEADHDGRTIVLDVWLARRRAGEPVTIEHDAVGWFAAGELATLDWPEADLPLLGPLARALGAAAELARGQAESAAGE